MRRKLWVFLALLALMLSACGTRQEADVPDTESPVSEAAAEPAEPAPGPKAVFSPAENNGGNFVRMDGRVYFRRYGDDALAKEALWGDFLIALPEQAGESELCYYDEADGTVETLCADDGIGPIWCTQDGFALSRVAGEGRMESYLLSYDGETVTALSPGRVVGVSETGRYTAVQPDGDDWATLVLYEGTSSVAAAKPEADEFFELCGFAGDAAIFLSTDYNSDEFSLWQLTPDGKTLRLGILPVEEDAASAPIFEQFLADGETVYCLFSFREGTSMALSDTLCVQANAGHEDSVEVFDVSIAGPASDYGEPPLPVLCRSKAAGVVLANHAPGDTELSEYNWGDLLYWDTPDSALRLLSPFLPASPYDGGGRIAIASEVAGDAVYVLLADVERAPDADVGWRMALARKALTCLRVPLAHGAQAETLYGDVPENAETLPGLLFSLDIGVSEEEARSGAKDVFEQPLGPENEDTDPVWVRLRCEKDGTLVRFESAALDDPFSHYAGIEGVFLPGKTVGELTMNAGETLALHVTLPWHPEARVTAQNGESWSEYIFGSENSLHLEDEEGKLPPRYADAAAAAPAETPEEALLALLEGPWVYKGLDTNAAEAVLRFDGTSRTVTVSTEEFYAELDFLPDFLYAEEGEQPDLLCLTAVRGDGLPDLPGFLTEGSCGDYLVSFGTDGTARTLTLTQANNGDGALSYLLGDGEDFLYEFTLYRYDGAAAR